MKSPEMLEWEWEFEKLKQTTSKPTLLERILPKKRFAPEPKAVITAFLVPKKWYQSKKLKLRCTCGWVSEDSYLANPPIEIAYTIRMVMRVNAELHWGRDCPITSRELLGI